MKPLQPQDLPRVFEKVVAHQDKTDFVSAYDLVRVVRVYADGVNTVDDVTCHPDYPLGGYSSPRAAHEMPETRMTVDELITKGYQEVEHWGMKLAQQNAAKA